LYSLVGCELGNRLTFNELNNKPQWMTFILGSRCNDGVVLIADRKITLTNEIHSISFEYKQKVFGILGHVI
jgi:20S proteasome alpha/beta subunit